MNSREELAVRVSHMSKWFTDQSYEATTLREVVEALRNGNAQCAPDPKGEMTKIAAECHLAKWQFDLSEDFQPSKSAARAIILQAFHELHRIGDMAIKVRDAYSVASKDQREAGRVEVTDGSVQQGDIITYALTDEGLGKIISHARPVTSTVRQDVEKTEDGAS